MTDLIRKAKLWSAVIAGFLVWGFVRTILWSSMATFVFAVIAGLGTFVFLALKWRVLK